MTWSPLQLIIDAGPDVMPEELDQLSRGLREELLDLDVITVDHATALAPAGSKAPSGIDVGTLVVTLSNSAVLVALAGILKSWVGRSSGRKVTMRFSDDADTIEISGAARQDVTAALQSWATRHEQQ